MITDSERTILNQIYRDSETGVRAIHALAGVLYDDDLTVELSRQAAKYSTIEEKAANRLYEKGERPQRISPAERARLWGGVRASTLLNTSTSHVARMMIENSASSATHVLKAIKHNPASSKEAVELAEEFLDFEESNIRRLRAYLEK